MTDRSSEEESAIKRWEMGAQNADSSIGRVTAVWKSKSLVGAVFSTHVTWNMSPESHNERPLHLNIRSDWSAIETSGAPSK
jgi:hypothetical protein